MIDWSSTRVKADAETVVCRFCHAQPGEPCVSRHPLTKGQPITHFPAHTCRVVDAEKRRDD